MREVLARYLRDRSIRTGKGVAWWRRLGNPTLADWSEYLRRHGGFYSFGENCSINPAVHFADPALTSIGNNVHIAGGFLTGHDGSVNMLNTALGTKLDAVGPIRILDDVFIGYGTIVLPNVTIGPRAIVGAGSVVTRDVPPDTVAAGTPAKVVSSLEAYVDKLKARNADWPWRPLVEQRAGEYDAELEPELQKLRQEHFFAAIGITAP
jgi:acetyltransferase-like isoleucine patch superfamily enzyme